MFRNYSNYEVYEDGKIWSYSRNKWLKPSTRKDGYKQVCLVDDEGKKKMYLLHRVIWEAVTSEQIPSNKEINHIDENKDNNARSNLELVSHKDNINYGSGISRRAKSISKQVGAFNKNGELVMVFKSTNEAGRNGFKQSAVSACCRNCFNKHGNNKYKGFEWRYI